MKAKTDTNFMYTYRIAYKNTRTRDWFSIER